MTLESLASATAQGDQQATQDLLQRLLPRVRNLTRALLGSDDEVDDIAQCVLLDTLRGLSGFRGEGSFKAWVDRITIRAAMTASRKRRARSTREAEANSDDTMAQHPQLPFEYVRKRELVGYLDELPIEQRAAIVLHHLAGMSVPEVAEEQQASVETVRSRIRLGMQRLRHVTAKRELA